jgi:ATP-dependent DNA helicase RecG
VPDVTPCAPDLDATNPIAPLQAPLTGLRGIGPARAEKLARLCGGSRVCDLLFHMPETYIDNRNQLTLAEAVPGTQATVRVDIVARLAPDNERQPWKVTVRDPSGFAQLVYFGRPPPPELVAGRNFVISGKVDRYGDVTTLQPRHAVPSNAAEGLPWIEPVWPLMRGLTGNELRAAMVRALAALPPLPEWHDPALLRREGWPGFAEALRGVQMPAELPAPKLRARLAYDELLAHQVAIAWNRRAARARPGRALTGDGTLRQAMLARFGHTLTASQAQALEEIDADLAAPRRMLRLLQGDVGSGKTLVAALAMLRAAEAGGQAAMMAPTETLARQHHRTLSALCPVPVGLLTGSIKGVARRNTLLGLQNGRIPIIVGTHALFQEGVAYKDLALAIIDEQHRFGVEQRLSMGSKGFATDVLVMTATPIPRTLLLTQWGEMAVSRLLEKPAGRQAIKTTLHSIATVGDVIGGIERALDRGDQVFWVCPLVSESELLDVAAAEARHAALTARFGVAVGLAHGRQDSAERERQLADFAAGRTRLLVATTVVEVGVDVPAASVMVVEHAERFGLAQLHQLRGRVGRGSAASFCLLLHDDGLTETARRRLILLRDTDDGFAIADEDFRIRGGGDLLGKRQSGQPGWRMADPVEHEGLLRMASRDAAHLLDRDPRLASARGSAIRLLLRLFARGEALRALGA